jgi:hypothetical protein
LLHCDPKRSNLFGEWWAFNDQDDLSKGIVMSGQAG